MSARPQVQNQGFPQDPRIADEAGNVTRIWRQLLLNMWNALGPGDNSISELTVGASPFQYMAPVQGQVFIVGASVTAVFFSRDLQNWYPVGFTNGALDLSTSDSVRILYSGTAPSVTFVPS